MSKNDSLRIGDTDRDKAIALLGRHFEAGRLTLDEYTDRMEAATDAQTRGDLKILTGDLPKLPELVKGRERPVKPLADRWLEQLFDGRDLRWFWLFIGLAWVILILSWH